MSNMRGRMKRKLLQTDNLLATCVGHLQQVAEVYVEGGESVIATDLILLIDMLNEIRTQLQNLDMRI